jgi:hypothetical protein
MDPAPAVGEVRTAKKSWNTSAPPGKHLPLQLDPLCPLHFRGAFCVRIIRVSSLARPWVRALRLSVWGRIERGMNKRLTELGNYGGLKSAARGEPLYAVQNKVIN